MTTSLSTIEIGNFHELALEPNSPFVLHQRGDGVIRIGLRNTHKYWKPMRLTSDNNFVACYDTKEALRAMKAIIAFHDLQMAAGVVPYPISRKK